MQQSYAPNNEAQVPLKMVGKKCLNFAENLTRLMLSKRVHNNKKRRSNNRLNFKSVLSSENLITRLQKESNVLGGVTMIGSKGQQ